MHLKSACFVLLLQMALLPVTSASANSVCSGGFIRASRADITEGLLLSASLLKRRALEL
jgi:hypothetical protein